MAEPDETRDPRPWWFLKFERDLFRRLDRQDQENDRRFTDLDKEVDSLKGDLSERVGGRKMGESWRLRWGVIGGALLVLFALVGAIATVAQIT